jgi:hypothetical protein
MPPPEDDLRTLGSGEVESLPRGQRGTDPMLLESDGAELLPRGSDTARPVPKGSGEVEPVPRGSNKAGPMPLGPVKAGLFLMVARDGVLYQRVSQIRDHIFDLSKG